MKFLNQLIPILWALVLSYGAFFLCSMLCESYINALKKTGELVTAKDIIEAKIVPWAIAVLVFAGTIFYNKNEKK